MFRVSWADEQWRTMITIDGQLSGESIKVVEDCCDRAMSLSKPVHLFLRDVSTIDQAGRTLLCQVASKGVRLLANGVYTAHLVRAVSPAGAEALNASSVAGTPNGPATRRK